MKFLEYSPLSKLNNFFQHVDVGNYTLHGELEAYSCKLAGVDKKLSKSLDQEVIAMMASGTSPNSLGTSPVGPLTDSNSRKTLVYLILTLNHMYPDYDFSNLRAHHFTKEMSASFAKNDIDSLLMETARVWDALRAGAGQGLQEFLWCAIHDAVDLHECDVYSYKAQVDEDPFSEEGNLWAFTMFFYNKKQKRMLCFSCRALSKTQRSLGQRDDDDSSEEMALSEDDEGPDSSFLDGAMDDL